MNKITRALLSVSDKTNIVEFARSLKQLGVEIISTGGTARLLSESGIPVTEVSEYTGFPEMLDGRVKTLHPKIHGGILGKRDHPEHIQNMARYGIDNIDLVCVNLYPFEATIAKNDCTLEEAIENIDIGGPTMVRAAAKNWQHVAVVTDSADYTQLVNELNQHQCLLTENTRFQLACKAFSHTAAYDGAIANYLTALTSHQENKPALRFPNRLNIQWAKVQDIRYGENPHQQAAFYRDLNVPPGSIANHVQLQGKALSYNNIADADAAWECVKGFDAPACVIVKHTNPCGIAIGATPNQAYQKAFSTDSTSAFGGIIAFNETVDAETASSINQQFAEVLIAPDFSEQALIILAQKKNIRVLKIPKQTSQNHFELKRVSGGLLVQTSDSHELKPEKIHIVTRRQPSDEELEDILFAWRVAQYVKSNAIIFCRSGQTMGIGAGQMSRIDSTKIAARKAQEAQLSLKGAVAASDAFFPFRDGLDVIATQGITAIIQPGGSIRDEEVINAANEHNISMIFTGIRHFRH